MSKKPESDRRAVLGKVRNYATDIADWINRGIELWSREDDDLPVPLPLPRDISEWLTLRRSMRHLAAGCEKELGTLDSLPGNKSL